MGKMTSLLEKYKLIEKDEFDTPELEEPMAEHDSQVTKSVTTTVSSSEETIPSSLDSTHNLSEDTNTSTIINETVSTSSSTSSSDAPPLEPTFEEVNSNVTPSAYDKLLSLDEIYQHLQLDQIAVTDTVFLLENLIKALPEELPEFVKKTTVNNIIQASAMNLPKLLEDGQIRSQSIKQFSIDYTRTNSEEITALKSEIARLSAIIADYHQQIKHKETLIAEETNLIQTEQNRIQAILEFFNN